MLVSRRMADAVEHARSSARGAVRAIRVDDRTFDVVLEQEFWDALDDIAQKERVDPEALCTEVVGRVPVRSGGEAAAALRVFVAAYLREKPVSGVEKPPRRLKDELRAIADEFAKFPDLDTRKPEDIIGYNEWGVFD